MFVDKRGAIERLAAGASATLELGCGERKRIPTSIGIDILDYECVDIVGDAIEVLGAMPERCVTRIVTHHFLEHLPSPEPVVEAFERVLQPGGIAEVTVPHFSNPYYYSDYTHRSQFGLYSFSYLTSNEYFRRQVPKYQKRLGLELARVDLVFKSSRPFYGRHALKQALGAVLNLNRYTQELYEENLCYVFPCYEIRYELRKPG